MKLKINMINIQINNCNYLIKINANYDEGARTTN